MTEPSPNHSRKITLEELLRLKRHERPGPEHWARFDRELNEKVWRALANPPEERAAGLPLWLARGLRWSTAGAVSALALVFAWHPGNVPTIASTTIPEKASFLPQVAVVPAPVSSSAPIRVASLDTQPVDVESTVKTTYAVSDLTPSTSPAGHEKIPATLAFPTVQMAGERFAADALNSAVFATRLHGSAY